MPRLFALVAALFLRGAAAHGYLAAPMSRQYMSNVHYQPGMPGSMRYQPQSSEGSGACGAAGEYEESTSQWDAWFSAAGVEMPVLAPGQEIEFSATITADHGGQAWLQVACANHIEEGLEWTLLERAPGDRDHHYLPSSPHIYAWDFASSGGTTSGRFKVPEGFSCPGGRGVGRYVWKTGNTCTDSGNIGRHSTETFSRDEFCAMVKGWCPTECSGGIETFLSCFDFATGAVFVA